MCNCGEEDLKSAQALRRKAAALALSAMLLGGPVISFGKTHPPVAWACAAVQVLLIVLAIHAARQRKKLLCADAN